MYCTAYSKFAKTKHTDHVDDSKLKTIYNLDLITIYKSLSTNLNLNFYQIPVHGNIESIILNH